MTEDFESLYRAGYSMVIRKCGDKLYSMTKHHFESYAEKVIKQYVIPILEADGVLRSKSRRLEMLRGEIKQHYMVPLDLVADCLMYMVRCTEILDPLTEMLMIFKRVYCDDTGLPSIYEIGVAIFLDRFKEIVLSREVGPPADYNGFSVVELFEELREWLSPDLSWAIVLQRLTDAVPATAAIT